MQTLGIDQKKTSPFYPQGNAMVERMHRTMSNFIRSRLINQGGGEWTDCLPAVMLALNEMAHELHGYSANEIMWGRGACLPVDLLWPSKPAPEKTMSEYVKRLKKSLQKVRKEVAPSNSKGSKGNNPFQVGDKMLVVKQKMERTVHCDESYW